MLSSQLLKLFHMLTCRSQLCRGCPKSILRVSLTTLEPILLILASASSLQGQRTHTKVHKQTTVQRSGAVSLNFVWALAESASVSRRQFLSSATSFCCASRRAIRKKACSSARTDITFNSPLKNYMFLQFPTKCSDGNRTLPQVHDHPRSSSSYRTFALLRAPAISASATAALCFSSTSWSFFSFKAASRRSFASPVRTLAAITTNHVVAAVKLVSGACTSLYAACCDSCRAGCLVDVVSTAS